MNAILAKSAFLILLFISLSVSAVKAQQPGGVYEISISNQWDYDKTDQPVCIPLSGLPAGFPVAGVIVKDGTNEIPSQLDDLNGDGQADELSFVLDVPAKGKRTVKIELYQENINKQYPARVFAQMLLRGDKGKHQHITSLTVDGKSNVYNLLHHHGPAFESELVAYRIYFDRKQTVDIYGKFNKQLEIEESQFYPTDEQLAHGFGDDVLMVGGSCGLGALKGWDGQKATHIEPVATRTESVLATGPVRTVVDIDANDWQYQGSNLNMKVRYILYAGHRDCEVQVMFREPLKQELLSAGIVNVKGSNHFSDGKGLVACWGTDWPVNDTVKYAKETVGLAISLPEKIVRKEHHDRTNYLYVIGAEGQKDFTYHISFTSIKETFGYKTNEEWYTHVRRWKKELNEPVDIAIRKL